MTMKSMMSAPMRVYLLDKNIIRHGLSGVLKLQSGRTLLHAEADVLTFLWQEKQSGNFLFMSQATANLFRRYGERAEATFFGDMVNLLFAGRYFRRWARRLLDYGFTREDAKILSLGTFGTNQDGDVLGVDVIVTRINISSITSTNSSRISRSVCRL